MTRFMASPAIHTEMGVHCADTPRLGKQDMIGILSINESSILI